MKQITPLKVGDETQIILVEMSRSEYLQYVAFLSGGCDSERDTSTSQIKKRDIRKGLNGIMEVFACGRSEAFK